jgi:hypothetical protein
MLDFTADAAPFTLCRAPRNAALDLCFPEGAGLLVTLGLVAVSGVPPP